MAAEPGSVGQVSHGMRSLTRRITRSTIRCFSLESDARCACLPEYPAAGRVKANQLHGFIPRVIGAVAVPDIRALKRLTDQRNMS